MQLYKITLSQIKTLGNVVKPLQKGEELLKIINILLVLVDSQDHHT